MIHPSHRPDDGPVFAKDPRCVHVQLVASLGSQIIPADLLSSQFPAICVSLDWSEDGGALGGKLGCGYAGSLG